MFFILINSVLNKFSEYTYFYILKKLLPALLLVLLKSLKAFSVFWRAKMYAYRKLDHLAAQYEHRKVEDNCCKGNYFRLDFRVKQYGEGKCWKQGTAGVHGE